MYTQAGATTRVEAIRAYEGHGKEDHLEFPKGAKIFVVGKADDGQVSPPLPSAAACVSPLGVVPRLERPPPPHTHTQTHMHSLSLPADSPVTTVPITAPSRPLFQHWKGVYAGKQGLCPFTHVHDATVKKLDVSLAGLKCKAIKTLVNEDPAHLSFKIGMTVFVPKAKSGKCLSGTLLAAGCARRTANRFAAWGVGGGDLSASSAA